MTLHHIMMNLYTFKMDVGQLVDCIIVDVHIGRIPISRLPLYHVANSGMIQTHCAAKLMTGN